MMSASKTDFSDMELGYIDSALTLYAESIQRQMKKHVTGSAMYDACAATYREVSSVRQKVFSLKGH